MDHELLSKADSIKFIFGLNGILNVVDVSERINSGL